MSCYISNNFTLDCRNASLGGVKKIWILGGASNAITGITTNNLTGEITGVTGTGTWYSFQLPKQTASFVEEISVNTEAQSVGFTPTLTISLPKLDQSLRNTFFELVKQNEIFVVMLDANGRYWLVGQENGLVATAGSLQTGTAFNDLNGVNALTLSGFEPNAVNEIDASAGIANVFNGFTFNA